MRYFSVDTLKIIPSVDLNKATCKTIFSGCGAVGKAIASNTRDSQFESSQRQYYLLSTIKNCFEKTKIKKKEAGKWPIFKKQSLVGVEG